jgi:D-beta-D-heptose 7-phosphate kinase/D-beta-D-heptose 1-phosphate adenosyltransferase
MKVEKNRLKHIIANFKKKRLLVVGDLLLDHYIFGKVERISPEAPVPIIWANRENFVCGGAANVGLNLVSLGAGVNLCGVLGMDRFGKVLSNLIRKSSIDSRYIILEKNRPTTLKTRIIAGHQQIARVDWESVDSLTRKVNNSLLEQISKHIDAFDAVIIEDYGKGVINPHLVKELVDLCCRKKKIITVDPKEEHIDYYRNVTALTPNLKEAQNAAGIKIKNKKEIPSLGKAIMQKLTPKCLLLTMGEDGMMLFADSRHYHIPTAALEVFDVTGAGDTVIAVFTLALSSGASFHEAAVISNYAAGIVVAKLGAATTTVKELTERIYAK